MFARVLATTWQRCGTLAPFLLQVAPQVMQPPLPVKLMFSSLDDVMWCRWESFKLYQQQGGVEGVNSKGEIDLYGQEEHICSPTTPSTCS